MRQFSSLPKQYKAENPQTEQFFPFKQARSLASYSNWGCLVLIGSNFTATSLLFIRLIAKYIQPNEPEFSFLVSLQYFPTVRSILQLFMKIDKSLVAIVTGGASGLGLATVELLRNQGANVVIADLNQEQGKQIAQKLNCLFFKTNVADEKNVQQLIKFTVQNYKKIHVVVNCAGIIAAGTTIYGKGVVSSQNMEKVLKINVIGTLNVCKHAAKAMSEQEEANGERGVLINVSSVAGIQGQKGQVVYSASKGAIMGMTLPMARDLGKYKIRVMTIAPGIFETPMGSGVNKKLLQQMMSNTPLGRLGNSTQFALAVEGIIKNSYATGDIWRLDGGIRLPYM